MSEQIRQYVEEERTRGIADEQIRNELLSKGWDPIAVHRGIAGEQSVKQHKELRLNSSNVLLVAGLSLIFIAAITFVGYSWPQLSALSRFLLVAVPNFLLFLIGSFLAKGEELQTVKDTTHVGGHLMLPISVGVFLYQFGFYDRADALLMAYSVLLALPLSVYVALVKQRTYGALLVTINLVALALFLLADQLLNGWRSSLLLTAVALLGVVTAWSYKQRHDEEATPALISASVIVFVISFSSLMTDLTRLLTSEPTVILGFSAVLTGFGLLAAAALFGQQFKPWTRAELFHQKLLYVSGILLAFLSLMGGDVGMTTLAIVSVVFAAIAVVIGMESRVKLITVLGLIGGSISLLNLLFSNIDRVTMVVLLFLFGFAAILLSIFLVKRGVASRSEQPEPGLSIGLIDDATAARLSVHTGEPPSFFTIVIRVVLALLLYWLIQVAFFSAASYDTGLPYGDTTEII